MSYNRKDMTEMWKAGYREAQKKELEFLKRWYGICCYKSSFKDDMIEERIKQLQKEIGEEKQDE